MREEMRVLTSPDTYRMEPEHAWQRLQTRVRKPKELAVLIEIAAWREREAQTRDVPRGRVLKDDVVGDIACRRPTTIERLGICARCPGLRALEMGRGDHRGGQARARTRRRRRCRRSSVPRERQRPGDVELLKVLLRMTAERHGWPPRSSPPWTISTASRPTTTLMCRRFRLAARAVRRQGARPQAWPTRARG
jgi:ribonuclease D